MKIDMSPQAVTNRMNMLDQLWELAVALKSSDMANAKRIENPKPSDGHNVVKTATPPSK